MSRNNFPKESLAWDGHRQRLRHRVEREGWDALRPHEMLELVLDHAVERQDLSDVARALVSRFGSVVGVFAADREALMGVEGMTERLADWIVLTAELTRAYYDLHAETDIRLGCYREVLAFLRSRDGGADGGFWALYADLDFNLITYTDFGPLEDCWDPAVARKMLVDAIGVGARYVYLVRWLGDAPPVLDEWDLSRLAALANTIRAADLDLVDFILIGRKARASLRGDGRLEAEVFNGRGNVVREAYFSEI